MTHNLAGPNFHRSFFPNRLNSLPGISSPRRSSPTLPCVQNLDTIMSTREARTQRRAAERKTKKAELRRQAAQAASIDPETAASAPPPPSSGALKSPDQEFSPELIAQANAVRERVRRRASLSLPSESCSKPDGAAPAEELCTRAETNRANSQRSTGPRSATGKARSSQNSFKHGLYSKQLVLPDEDPAELDAVRADLRAEHQPINETEAILVNELAEQFWRLRRMRELEADALSDYERLGSWLKTGFLAMIQRIMASAERGFHKALASLRSSQKERGFVPSESAPARKCGD